jgi:hypothetical protein
MSTSARSRPAPGTTLPPSVEQTVFLDGQNPFRGLSLGNQALSRFAPASACANILVLLVIVACVAAVTERWRRKTRHRLQIRLSRLLSIVAVIALVTAFLLRETAWTTSVSLFAPGTREVSGLDRYMATGWYPWPLRIPLLFGIGCAVDVAVSVGIWTLGKVALGLRAMNSVLLSPG